MTRWLAGINRLPIKWRLTLWSSFALCVLFVLYSAAQYAVLNEWSKRQEEHAIQQSMDEIQGYYAEKTAEDVTAGRTFLEKVNQNNQLIRIVDAGGNVIVSVAEEMPEHWVEPKRASGRQLQSVWHHQDHLLVLRSPLIVGTFAGTVEIVRNLETFEKLNKFLLFAMASGALIAVAISGFVGMLLARQLMKPISALTATIRKIKHNGLTARVAYIDNKDELSTLSHLFNEMMDRLEASFQQQKQFVEDASHELRTPIAIIEGHLSLLARWGKNDASVLDESLRASQEELRRLKELTQELLALSRAESLLEHAWQGEAADPGAIVGRIVDDFAVLHPAFAFDVEMSPLAGVRLAIAERHLKQIVTIVLDNAVKYSGDRRRIEIAGAIANESAAHIRITDYGIGIPSEDMPRIFDRFYRVDKARSRQLGGSGLGLAIAKRLAESYGGAIAVTSVEHRGTVVTLTFPYLIEQVK